MNLPHLKLLTMTAGFAAIIKFLFDGVIIHYGSNSLDLGHLDSLSYATLLAPILAAHSYSEKKGKEEDKKWISVKIVFITIFL